jgi:hypothetical protein
VQLAQEGKLRRIGVAERQLLGGDAIDLDDAEVREPWDEQGGQPREGRAEIERRREQVSRLGEELQLGLLRVELGVPESDVPGYGLGVGGVQLQRERVEVAGGERERLLSGDGQDGLPQQPIFADQRADIVAQLTSASTRRSRGSIWSAAGTSSSTCSRASRRRSSACCAIRSCPSRS